jgi:hypothetical protein
MYRVVVEVGCGIVEVRMFEDIVEMVGYVGNWYELGFVVEWRRV